MFDPCRHKEKGVCAFAGRSKYDPEAEEYLWETHTFCGAMSGTIDARTKKLSQCWLKMSNGQRSKHVKKVNNEVFAKRGYYYNNASKTWVRI